VFGSRCRSRTIVDAVRVVILTTLRARVSVGVGFFVRFRLRKLNRIIVLHYTPKLGTPVEMIQFLLKLLLKQRILAVNHDFHRVLVATKLLTAKLHSLYVKKSGVGKFGKVGLGTRVRNFTSDSATFEAGLVRAEMYFCKASCHLAYLPLQEYKK